jgi:hypothetical protein
MIGSDSMSDEVPEDVARLREDFPEWEIGTSWVCRASGTDVRSLWAARNGERVSALTEADLRAALRKVMEKSGRG